MRRSCGTRHDYNSLALQYYIRPMKPMRFASAVAGVAMVGGLWSVAVPQGQGPATAAGLDAAFSKFWDARSRAEAAHFVDTVLSTGVTYDDALRRLKRGRSYI